MKRTIIAAAALAVALAGPAAKADSCSGAATTAREPLNRLYAEAREILQRRARAHAAFIRGTEGAGPLTWDELHGRFVATVLAMKEIDEAFRDYMRNAQTQIDIWSGIARACGR